MRPKRVPSTRKSAPRALAGVKNAYPEPKSASKTRTLSPKVRPPDPGGRQKRVPSTKKCVKNAYPQPESSFTVQYSNHWRSALYRSELPQVQETPRRQCKMHWRLIRRPSVGVSDLVWGRGLPLPYPSPLGGPIHQVARRTRKSADPRSECQISFGGEVYLSPTPLR